MKKASLLKKVVCMSGSVIRVALGAGALALLVMGVSNGRRKRSRDAASSRDVSRREGSRRS